MEVLPYTPQDFNTRIPHYEDAFERFDTVEGKALVDSDIHDLFLAHKMEKTFGITIAHRHFVLNNNEHLVAYGNTSTPWSDVAKDDSTIKAVTWFITPGGAVQPYEFEFTISEKEVLDPNSPEQTKFVQELAKLLKEKKVEGLFGLVKYPGDDFKGCLETTQGRANICFVKGEHNFEDIPQSEATWFFSDELFKTKRPCSCSRPTALGDHRHYGHAS